MCYGLNSQNIIKAAVRVSALLFLLRPQTLVVTTIRYIYV